MIGQKHMKGHKSSSVVSDSVTHGLYSLWNSLGQNTGVGSLSFLQGIFPTQGSNPGLLHCRQNLLPAEPQRKPKNTGVGSLSLPQQMFLTQVSTRVACIWGGFFTNWAIREAHSEKKWKSKYSVNMTHHRLCQCRKSVKQCFQHQKQLDSET